MKRIVITILILNVFVALGQDKKINRANKEYEDYAYIDAINSYEDLAKKGLSDQAIYKKLGNASYMNARYEGAAKWYGKLVQLENTDIESEYYYRYALSLKSIGDYTTSDIWMEKYAAKSGLDGRATMFENNRDYLKEIEKNSGKYKVKLANINSEMSDFAPSFYGNDLIFSSARKVGENNIHNWNNQPFLNLYSAKKETNESFTIHKMQRKINSKAHESSTAVSKDRTTIYFTRNNYDDGFGRDDLGVSRLKLFRATIDGDDWKDIEEMNFNSKEYSVAHPALNNDNTKLFFASDMPGTLGNSDIFYVDLHDDGSYGTPINLGKEINTEGRETFPFVAEDDILYFSSDARPGLGGLDIFATNILVENNTKTEVINLAKPINTKEDDFSFIVDKTGKKGYFSSNRPNGVGDDDIYSFTITEPLVFDCNNVINGVVKDKKTGDILVNSNVQIQNDSGMVLATTTANEKGEFNIVLDCDDKKITAIGTKTNYQKGTANFRVDETKQLVELLLTPVLKTEATEDLARHLGLSIIYFDFDNWNIRKDASVELQKILNYMNAHPEVKINISSHTDSRGSTEYNRNLSKNRAQSTRKWLISKGISMNRLTAKGYGESQLENGCANGVKCSNTEHDMNRRSEFKVVN